MSFKFNKIGQNTPISQDLFYSMARNDDTIKNIYDSCSLGVIGWTEASSAINIPAIDQDTAVDGTDDPDWHSIASLTIYPQNERVLRLRVNGVSVTHQPRANISTAYKHALNGRFSIQIPDEAAEASSEPTTAAVIPCRFVISGNTTVANQAIEYGSIVGSNFCIASENYLSNPPLTDLYKNYVLIKPTKSVVNFEIKKLDISQNINATAEDKFQFIIEDIGGWR